MLFYFSVYSSLLLIGFVQGIVFTGLLLWRGIQEERLSDKLLAAILIVCCLHISQYMLGFAGWYDARDWHSTFMFYFPFHNLLLLGPLIYYYFLALTNDEFVWSKKDIKHFIPGSIYILIFIFLAVGDIIVKKLFMGIPFDLHFQTKGSLEDIYEGIPKTLFHIASIISLTYYLIRTVIEYRKYKKYVNDHFSDTLGIEYEWIRNLLYAVIAGMTIMLIIGFVDVFITNLSYDQFWTSHLTLAITIYVISIMGYQSGQRTSRKLAYSPDLEMIEEKNGPSLQPEVNEWKEKIERCFREHKPYLDPALTLKQLASQLGTNSSVLSKAINSGFGKNFNDFINSYRIEEVKKQLEANVHEQQTLISIAMDCGFNSKPTFNRAFKKLLGQSPREYLKQ